MRELTKFTGVELDRDEALHDLRVFYYDRKKKIKRRKVLVT
jgi:hypothetical protein